MPREHAKFLTGEACVAWRKAIEKRDFAVVARADDDRVRVFRPLYLLELAARFASFDAQLNAVARHIDESLSLLIEEPPPPRGAEQPLGAAGGARLEAD